MRTASREAEVAINVAIDTGFVDVAEAARAVPKAKMEPGVDYHVRDWLEHIRGFAGRGWRSMELDSTRGWQPPPQVRVVVGRTVKVKIEAVTATKQLACNAASVMIKAEARCTDEDLARGVKWLMKQPPSYWAGGTAKCTAFRRCNPNSAYDWYVLLIVEMRQELGIVVSGFETDPAVLKRVRARRRCK
jgi:hypothetical protein